MDGLTRHEQFLYAIASGQGAAACPDPLTREETIFVKIADKVKEISNGGSGGGGGASGSNTITFDDNGNIIDTSGNIGFTTDDDIDNMFP